MFQFSNDVRLHKIVEMKASIDIIPDDMFFQTGSPKKKNRERGCFYVPDHTHTEYFNFQYKFDSHDPYITHTHS